MTTKSDRATIADVARLAGTSVTSVSNLLNGRTRSMSLSTAERIRSAVTELNFRPSATARALVRQRTALLGVMVSEIETGLFLQGISRMEARAREHEFGVLIAGARTADDEARGIDLFIEKQTDAIIFLSTSASRVNDHLERAADAGIPVVLVNRADAGLRFDHVGWDNRGGIVAAVDHLVGLGHRRIANLVGPPARISTVERIAGYRSALAAHGIPFDPALLAKTDYDDNPSEWGAAALALMRHEDPPTALIAADDIVAGMVMRALASAGYKVPGDVSIVGVDDQPFAEYFGLTTVRLPILEAGLAAVDLLMARMADPSVPPQRRTLECPLVVRTTTAPPTVAHR